MTIVNTKHKKILLATGILIILFLIIGFGSYAKNFFGAIPLLKPVPETNTNLTTNNPDNGIDETGLGLKIPSSFKLSIFAQNLPDARVMQEDSFGNLWVSQPDEGVVSLLEIDKETGKVKNQGPVFKNLKKPHGLAINPQSPFGLYIAEEHRIIRVPTYSEYDETKIADLPSGEGHSSRTIKFGPDNRLYVSIGSSCNVCHEEDNRRSKIFSMDKDGKDFKEFAKGLRNAVFFTWHPKTSQMWATEMGRDNLGDNIPPDEINIISENKNFGWPICYGKNIHDTQFDKNTYFRNPCMEPFEDPSYIDVPAHSAPLGLSFIPKEWGSGYADDLLVTYHGSWNRSTPTGYKIVRYKLDENGVYQGEEDFITGWFSQDKKEVFGRPVDILIKSWGAYITDDRRGVIYKLETISNN